MDRRHTNSLEPANASRISSVTLPSELIKEASFKKGGLSKAETTALQNVFHDLKEAVNLRRSLIKLLRETEKIGNSEDKNEALIFIARLEKSLGNRDSALAILESVSPSDSAAEVAKANAEIGNFSCARLAATLIESVKKKAETYRDIVLLAHKISNVKEVRLAVEECIRFAKAAAEGKVENKNGFYKVQLTGQEADQEKKELETIILGELSRALSKIGDFAGAKACFRHAEISSEGSSYAREVCGCLASNKKFKDAFELAKKISHFEDRILAFREIGRVCNDRRVGKPAKEFFLQMAKSAKTANDGGKLLSLIGLAQIELGAFEDAQKSLKLAWKGSFDGTSPTIRPRIPEFLAEARDIKAAIKLSKSIYSDSEFVSTYRRAVHGIKNDRIKHDMALRGISLIQLKQGDFLEAFSTLKDVVRRWHTPPQAINTNSKHLTTENEVALVEYILAETVGERGLKHYETLQELVTNLVKKERFELAIKLTSGLKEYGDCFVKARIEIARALFATGEREWALVLLREINTTETPRGFRDSRNELAEAQFELGDINAASATLSASQESFRNLILRVQDFNEHQEEFFKKQAVFSPVVGEMEVADIFFDDDLAARPSNKLVSFDSNGIISLAATKVKSTQVLSKHKLQAYFQGFFKHFEALKSRDRKNFLLKLAAVGSPRDIEKALLLVSAEEKPHLRAAMFREHLESGYVLSPVNARRLVSLAKKELASELKTKTSIGHRFAKCWCDNLLKIGSKESHDLIIEKIREELESIDIRELRTSSPFLPRFLQAALELNTHKGNNLLHGVVTSPDLDSRLKHFLIIELIKNEYISKDVLDWLEKRKSDRKHLSETVRRRAELEDTDIIGKLLSKGIIPSKVVLFYLVDEDWKNERGETIESLDERLHKLDEHLSEFNRAATHSELIEILAPQRKKALGYYAIYSGATRFSLINNYSFEKFFDVLGISHDLRINNEAMNIFDHSLATAGISSKERKKISQNLIDGRHPFHSEIEPQMMRTIRLDVSDEAKLGQANTEASQVIGKRQLGVCLKAPIYRTYLTEMIDDSKETEHVRALFSGLNLAETFSEREHALGEIERVFPELRLRVIEELRGPWARLGEKLVFATTVENILDNETNPVNCEELISHIEHSRLSLKRAKEDLLLALKGENPRIKKLTDEIKKKERAIKNLREGLSRNPSLESKIKEIETELAGMQEESKALKLTLVAERYSHLSPQLREQTISEESAKLKALAEKDPAAIFICLVMETIGSHKLTEGDTELIKEMASHLEHPFQIVSDVLKLDNLGRRKTEGKTVRIRYLDKKDDLMTLVRFADSKICCFSSSNYEMQVKHGTPNKHWVASIVKDPLSFVFEIEEPTVIREGTRAVTNNLGFVFGMFGIGDNDKPVVFLNGVYLSTGNDEKSSLSILNAIEELLSKRIGAAVQVVGSFYGGSLGSDITGYERDQLVGIRLRALSDRFGDQETCIYDDLGSVVNTQTTFNQLQKRI